MRVFANGRKWHCTKIGQIVRFLSVKKLHSKLGPSKPNNVSIPEERKSKGLSLRTKKIGREKIPALVRCLHCQVRPDQTVPGLATTSRAAPTLTLVRAHVQHSRCRRLLTAEFFGLQ
jgi:hypothetical protein